MADFGSSLPIRTESPGDAAIKIVDSTTPSQGLAVDSSGKISTKLNDGTGNLLASLVSAPVGSEQGLIVRNIPSGTQPVSGTFFQATQPVSGTVSANIRDAAGAAFSTLNPLPVAISADVLGDDVISYQTNSAVAAAGSSNHDYAVSAGKTLLLKQVHVSASGKAKIEVQTETGVATGVFNTIAVLFNSTANPNMTLVFPSIKSVAAGVKVRVIRTNKDNSAQDLYSTIFGQEI